MNDPLTNLFVAVVSYVTARGSYVTKTKLLKLLYLFDVEFYRAHGRTFTGFEWKYFHLGPWTREFDPLLQRIVAQGDIVEKPIDRADFDTKFLRAAEAVDLRKPFDSYKDEAILKTLLDVWGPSTTGEILDYVYFRTEPMERGIRNELLDFSTVLQQVPARYKRPASKETAAEITRLRREFGRKIAGKLAAANFEFTEPRYDDEFREAIAKLDAGNL